MRVSDRAKTMEGSTLSTSPRRKRAAYRIKAARGNYEPTTILGCGAPPTPSIACLMNDVCTLGHIKSGARRWDAQAIVLASTSPGERR